MARKPNRAAREEGKAPTNTPLSTDSLTVASRKRKRSSDGTFARGNPGGPGRPKGSPNRVNAVLRDDILQAYEERGGVKWLCSLPCRDFVRLLEKVLPKRVAADVSMQDKGQFALDLSKLSDEQLSRLAHAGGFAMDDIAQIANRVDE